ncbi:uncharacterized protein FFB14_01830 [Fusarium fujikuroi]|nr:uncharacterized protein FFB14_01830 [Fusarium fujikuroi]
MARYRRVFMSDVMHFSSQQHPRSHKCGGGFQVQASISYSVKAPTLCYEIGAETQVSKVGASIIAGPFFSGHFPDHSGLLYGDVS